uniref:SMC-Scp complex subunit ScpB n=1 Tax=uncultured Oscillibacter sp. TaxID=876091 RepID=UPI0025FDE3AB
MESMEFKEIESAVEAILFASGDPIQTERICVALDIDRPAAEQVLQKLMDHYAYDRRGVRLVRVEDTWQLCSAPDYADAVRRAFEIRKPARLSQPALEVLTIIAYYQPTTRAYVDQIRGVD